MTSEEAQSIPPELEEAVRRLLERLPDNLIQAARLSAIPRAFDLELLKIIDPTGLPPEEAAERLEAQRVLRKDPAGRYRFPSYVRHQLLAWWEDPAHSQDFLRLNRTAQEYYEALSLNLPTFQQARFQREALYHLLIIDEESGFRRLGALFEDAHDRYQQGAAEDLVCTIAEIKERLSPAGREWLKYYTARLDLMYRRDDLGKGVFQDLCSSSGSPVLKAVACWSLGLIHLDDDEWSTAYRLFKDGLTMLSRQDRQGYSARLMLALGNTYVDLATNSGGILAQETRRYGPLNQLLHAIEYLPSRIYEYLLHRVSWIPALLLPGTSYQDWIIAYLLLLARDWYRRAEQELAHTSDDPARLAVMFCQAEIEFEKGRWSRAGAHYTRLESLASVRSSPYRTARLEKGQGKVALAFGELEQAVSLLERAAHTFQRVRDLPSYAETKAQLGLAHTRQGNLQSAAAAYLASFAALGEHGDQLTQTQVLWRLEDLLNDGSLDEETSGQVFNATETMQTRTYIARFADTVLRQFRRVALIQSLPIVYVLLGIALIFSLTIPESLIALLRANADLSVLSLVDLIILTLGMVLPLPLAIWLYQFMYGAIGSIGARVLGNRLVPIENEQPDIIKTDPAGVTVRNASKGTDRRLTWEKVTAWAQVEFKLWLRPIQLISWIALLPGVQPMAGKDTPNAAKSEWILPAITTGYERLKRDLHARLGSETPRRKLDLVFIVSRWTALAAVLSAVYALIVVFGAGTLRLETELKTGEIAPLWFSSILTAFVLTMLLVYPAVTLWRVLAHQRLIKRQAAYSDESIPRWLIWLGGVFFSLLSVGWIVLWLNLHFE